MDRATITELKNNLSALLRKVRAGRPLLILDRDEPIARLEPVQAADSPDDRLLRLERQGLIRRGSGGAPLEPVPLAGRRTGRRTGRGIVDALIEERREGR